MSPCVACWLAVPVRFWRVAARGRGHESRFVDSVPAAHRALDVRETLGFEVTTATAAEFVSGSRHGSTT